MTKTANGQEYLLPRALAEAAVYHPIPLSDQLVINAVNINMLIFIGSPMMKSSQHPSVLESPK